MILFQGAETHTRSVLKAVSWRTLGTLDTFVISWFLTGKLELAGLIAGFEFITKIGWYYLHERVWASIVIQRCAGQPSIYHTDVLSPFPPCSGCDIFSLP